MDKPIKLRPKLREVPKLKPTLTLPVQPKLKPTLKVVSLASALPVADTDAGTDTDDPMSMPLPGFNVTLKAHKTKKPGLGPGPGPGPGPSLNSSLGFGQRLGLTRPMYSDLPNWHLSTINSISSGRPCRKGTEIIALLPNPTLPSESNLTGVVCNLYKPSTEERDLFTELMSDQVYFTDSAVLRSGKSALNSASTIMKHMKQFRKQLPPYWESSIYVRGNDEDMTSYQFVIAGPRDTPYDNGLFLYYMRLPSDYPTNPPIITFGSTDKGRFRINPNLYAGGKVCLDLLGTFGNAWTHNSNMVQVLLAIQAQIMVELPLQNEPSYCTVRGVNNVIYNALLRIVTMRVAMITPILTPYSTFGDLIDKFFYGPKRMEIVMQMYTWVQAAKEITVDQCRHFIHGYYSYMAGGGDGAGGGIGLLPTAKMQPEQLRIGIVELTIQHAAKVLDLLNAECPVW